ncbi:hypothetical protein [Arthrobacter sp. H41]|uniref:hypothetical protein n=1 Tax=Arthrobacter sp. H41 TaxID=1312978 RepID=UPI00047C2057|nr:hypothetical protein [Arthrobacter sp. H41]
MYGWIFRQLPGPLWARILTSVLMIAVVVAVLFQVIFPWLSATMDLANPTIGAASAPHIAEWF